MIYNAFGTFPEVIVLIAKVDNKHNAIAIWHK